MDSWARAACCAAATDATFIAYGALAQNAMLAADELAAEGINVEVIDARFCKPIDGDMLAPGSDQRPSGPDHRRSFPPKRLRHRRASNTPSATICRPNRSRRLGMPDRLIAHATRKEQLAEVGLDSHGIAGSVRAVLRPSIKVALPASAVTAK